MILIDNFPFNMSDTELGEYDIELFQAGMWMGPTSPEIEAARLQGLKDSWVGADERRAEQSAWMKSIRYEGPTHVNGMSKTHKENLSKAAMGNQNARKKPK